MKISKKTQYGLRSMIFLAEKEDKEYSPLSVISKEESIPFLYLEKILKELEKGGVVKSKKGRKGGYLLSRPSSKISLAEIMKILDSEIIKMECSECSKISKCRAKIAWAELEKSILLTLNNITIDKLLKK